MSITARAQSPTPTPSGFETFVVSKEARAEINKLDAGSLTPPPSSTAAIAPYRLLPTPRDRVTAQAMLTLFPGLNDLSINVAGQYHGRAIEGRLSPFRWFEGGLNNPGYFQMTRGGQGLRIGDDYSDLLGTAQGLRLFSPWHGGQGTLGLGMYQRLRDGYSSTMLTPAADVQWRAQPGLSLGALAAADSSVRLTQQAQGQGWQAYSFQGHDAGTNRPEAGLHFEGRPTQKLSLYNRLIGWAGDRGGYHWSIGATQQIGQSMISLDRMITNVQRSRLSQTGLGAFIPIRRQSLFLRWNHGTVTGLDGNSAATSQRFDALSGTLFSTLDQKTAVWASGSGFWQQAARPQSYVSLGASRILSGLWSVQAELSQRIEQVDTRVRLSVGYQVSRESQVRLLFGPSLAPSSTGHVNHTFGVQLVRSITYVERHTGTILGQVLQDGRPCGHKLNVTLNGQNSVETDAEGRFKIARVPVGDHTVELGLAALPTDLSPMQATIRVQVKRGKETDVEFAIRRVGQIRGVILVGTDEFGRQDPTAGIGVTVGIADDIQTTTNAESEFLLGNVPPGKHTIVLNTDTLPPDFEVAGSPQVTVEVDPGKPAPIVEFRVAPRARKVDFGATEEKSEPVVKEPVPAPPSPAQIEVLPMGTFPEPLPSCLQPWGTETTRIRTVTFGLAPDAALQASASPLSTEGNTAVQPATHSEPHRSARKPITRPAKKQPKVFGESVSSPIHQLVKHWNNVW